MLNKYNLDLIKQGYINDMSSITYINNNELKELLKFSQKTYYYNHRIIDPNKINIILDNRNLNHRYKIKRAIVIKRCNGKLLPSNIILYSKISDNYFDRNQALELSFALPIYIIHISKDKLWYFIKSYNYYCWVHKDNVCIVNEEIFNKYLNPTDFVIATNNFYINNNYIDIGVKLPIYKEDKYITKVFIPEIKNNKYQDKIINVNNINVNKGYLTYNHNALFKQALRYLNIPYGWGGMNNGIDCSSFIANTYKVFGYLLPRDTSKQKYCVGNKIIYIKNLSYIQKYKIISSINIPAILYKDGHVMLLLKKRRKRLYIIHASSNYMRVVINQLDNKLIDSINSIHLFIN